jgi:hypothetical protein
MDNRTPILDRSDYSVVWAERFPHETDGDVLARVSRNVPVSQTSEMVARGRVMLDNAQKALDQIKTKTQGNMFTRLGS